MQPQTDSVEVIDKKVTWKQIGRVIRLAEKVKLEAENVISSFNKEIKQLPDANNLKLADPKYGLICGNITSKWGLFWDYTILSAITQFGGGFGTFTKDGKKYVKTIIDHGLKNDWLNTFWKKQDEHGDNIAWLFHRTILLDSLVRFAKEEKELIKNVAVKLYGTNGKDGILCGTSRQLVERFKSHNSSQDSLTTDQQGLLQFTRQYNIIKLSRRLAGIKEVKESLGEICEVN